MKILALLPALAAAVFLAASASPAAAQSERSTGLLVGDGFRLIGSTRKVAFGEAEADVIAHVSQVFAGQPTRSRADRCRNGVFDYADWGKGLKLVFQDGRLVGWVADRAIAPGYTNPPRVEFGRSVSAMRAENPGLILADAVRGRAFGFAGFYGQVWQPGGDATIDLLSAGADCRPR